MPGASSWWSWQSFWAVHCSKTNFNLLSDEVGKQLLLTARLQFSCRHSCSRHSFHYKMWLCSSWGLQLTMPALHSFLLSQPTLIRSSCSPGKEDFSLLHYQLLIFVQFISVLLLILLLQHSPEALGNGLSSRQTLGQEMSYSHCFKMHDFKKAFSLGAIGRIRAQAQTGRTGQISLTFSWNARCYLLHQDPLGISFKGIPAVIRI